MNHDRSRGGFTITEVMVVVAIIGIFASMAVPGTQRWLDDQDARTMSRTIASAFHTARQESLRTGRNHIVFLSANGAGDTAGNALVDTQGTPVPILILDDGVTGSANQNCEIDAGESIKVVQGVSGLNWGFSQSGGAKAPADLTAIATATGSSFQTPAGIAATWVVFGADGTPLAFDGACSRGQVGSANGAVYLTNGKADYAVVLTALGATRVHAWDPLAGQWRI